MARACEARPPMLAGAESARKVATEVGTVWWTKLCKSALIRNCDAVEEE